MSQAVQQYEQLKRELTEALALRAQCDEKITALRNVLQGAGLGVELQKAATAEAAPAE
jgi:hypothetical protein